MMETVSHKLNNQETKFINDIFNAGNYETLSENQKEEILKIHTKSMPLAKDVSLEKLAEITEGYTGADIEAVCREAAMFAARENRDAKEVNAKHFEEALKKVTSSLTKERQERYEETADNLKRMIA